MSNPVKAAIAAVIVAVIFFAALVLYVDYMFAQANAAVKTQLKVSQPHLGTSIFDEELLYYNYSDYLYPYVGVSYIVSNASRININASLYKYVPPSRVFMLNYTNACYECGNVIETVASMRANMTRYGLGGISENLTTINIRDLYSLPNDSVLIVLNGLLPINFDNTTVPLMQTLLQRHTTILYVGQNFTVQMVIGASSTQELVRALPGYLRYGPAQYPPGKNPGAGFYFNKPTFSLSGQNSSTHGYISYINAFNGSIVAFPNTLSSWKTPAQAGADLAKALSEMFWLPAYAQGFSSAQTAQNESARIGVILNSIKTDLNASTYDTGYIRAVVSVNSSINASYSIFHNILARPAFTSNGTMSTQGSYLPGNNYMRFTFDLNDRPANATKLSAFLYIYDQNMSLVVPPTNASTIPDFSASSPPFILISNNTLGPGNYEVILRNFTANRELAAGYFNVSPIQFNFLGGNFTYNDFLFDLTSANTVLNGIPYSITFDNQYPQNGISSGGKISYNLPPGTSVQSPYVFKIILYSVPHYIIIYRYVQPFVINTEYIETVIVGAMVAIMIVFVRAPLRDEFYIDVPNLPEGKKTPVQIKAADILSMFPKLNASYHWKYMPLSVQEIRSAIATNLKYNNIPIYLTYSNLSAMLNSMQVKGYLESADDLYAPSDWIKESGHDIEYLATFKKLRLHFVTHSYLFTEIGQSTDADIVATLHGEKSYIVIYSKTSKFMHVPMYPGSKTYLVFLDQYKREDFNDRLRSSMAPDAETLRMYIAADYIRVTDAEMFEGL